MTEAEVSRVVSWPPLRHRLLAGPGENACPPTDTNQGKEGEPGYACSFPATQRNGMVWDQMAVHQLQTILQPPQKTDHPLPREAAADPLVSLTVLGK